MASRTRFGSAKTGRVGKGGHNWAPWLLGLFELAPELHGFVATWPLLSC